MTNIICVFCQHTVHVSNLCLCIYNILFILDSKVDPKGECQKQRSEIQIWLHF